MPRKKGKIIPQKRVATCITLPMAEALEIYLAKNAHVTPSDYLRDLIRRDLKQHGFLKIVNAEEIKEE